jgi:mono/diheme cytochrome c family protein
VSSFLNKQWVATGCAVLVVAIAYTVIGLAADSTSAAVQSGNPLSGNEDSIKKGKRLYRGVCARCHGRNAEGSARMAKVGNLQKFSRGYDGYRVVVVNGRKKMPAWGGILTTNDIDDIGAYLETLAVEGSDWVGSN